MSPFLYSSVYLYATIVMSIVAALYLSNKTYYNLQGENRGFIGTLTIAGILVLWLGGRSTSPAFGDTYYYVHSFHELQNGIIQNASSHGEWMWSEFMKWCASSTNYHTFLTIIEAVYIGGVVWVCRKTMANNSLVAFLFFMGSFSFYTYGVNGIRNGMAFSLVFIIFSLFLGNNFQKCLAVLLAYLTYYIHSSTILPLGMFLISLWLIKDFKYSIYIWVGSIVISLIAGNSIGNYLAELGFDDRLDYLVDSSDEDMFTRIGFRWDFLLYSMMPILLGYYVIIKRGLRNRIYEVFLNTYTLSNAVWILIIRSSYSNRFAYLSWFMFPLLLAYPLLKMDIWGDQQGKKTASILMAQVGFTWFMNIFY